jgi:hypothetical protein
LKERTLVFVSNGSYWFVSDEYKLTTKTKKRAGMMGIFPTSIRAFQILSIKREKIPQWFGRSHFWDSLERGFPLTVRRPDG